MDLPPFLTRDPDGEICLTGHRIRLIDVAKCYDEGRSPEGILLDCYPTLNLALIHKAIAFYLENEAETRALMSQNEAEVARQMQESDARPHPNLEELRARMAARRRAAAS
jgi:uncharacterized protein (DUF433 family)